MDTRIIFIFTTVYVICIISLFLIGFFVGRKIAKSREEIKELEKEKTILKGVLATARVQRQDIQDGIDRCSILLKGIQQEYDCAIRDKDKLDTEIGYLQDKRQAAALQTTQMQEIAKQQKEASDKAVQDFKEITSAAQEQYFQALEEDYEKKNQEYEQKCESKRQELAEIEASIKAKLEARKREQEIEDNKDNYRLNLMDTELRDIHLLNSIKDSLSSPAAVNKIIWSNYYQPLAKTKFPKIIGKATTCGIYKLTNTLTGEAYVGQSNDICERWKQHCKDALGAGTKAATAQAKLYGNIRKAGLNNFTFEVLEECSAADLNKKEKEYIALYNTYNEGLNSTRGGS